MLILNNISQNYKQGNESIRVLENLSIKIDKSYNVGLIGPSGSGKSTVLNLLGLLESPKKGSISINGHDCSSLNLEEKTNFRRKFIGFIFQNNQLLEDFTCEENVALPLILNGTPYKESIIQAQDLLKKFGLDKRLKYKPSLLSGGEQQRVSVLRALIKKPLILLADEPTGSLDEKNAKIVFEQILNISKVQKTLCITATHNMKLLKYFDLSLKIEKGKLIEIR